MLQLIKRCPEYAEGYKSYCQEAYDHNIVFFRPSNPKYLVDDWFERTKECKRRPLSLLHQFPNPDTEESGDIFNQLIFGFAESVFPVAACSAHQAECFVSGGL